MSWFIWTVESEGTQIEPDKLTLYLRWLLKKVGVECKERKKDSSSSMCLRRWQDLLEMNYRLYWRVSDLSGVPDCPGII